MMYGLLVNSTRNIGDDIQSLAARQFLPRVDFHIDREFLNAVELRFPAQIILNGWFCHAYIHEGNPRTPKVGLVHLPGSMLQPLIIGFHCDILIKNTHPAHTKGTVDFLRRHAPIGCRDRKSLQTLQEHGVESYFSGCLTLGLTPSGMVKQDYALDIDSQIKVPEPFPAGQPPVLRRTHRVGDNLDYSARLDEAARRLGEIEAARWVVTSRLHAALACIALGTPVIFARRDISDYYRCADYESLFDHVVTSERELADLLKGEINAKPKPMLDSMRAAMRERIAAFLQ